MNGWRYRVTFLAALWAAAKIHADMMHPLPNTPLGMLVFHGSAGLIDLILIYCAPTFLSGPLCDDTQTLCLISIVANFLGWLLYLAYAPPAFYNSFMWGLGCVQSVRLFLVDDDASSAIRRGMVRRHDLGRA